MVPFFKEHPHAESGRAARHFDSLAEEVLVAGSQHFRPAGGMGSQIFGGVMMWMFPKIVGFPPKSSIFRRFSIINHPILGYPHFRKHPCITKEIKEIFKIFVLSTVLTPLHVLLPAGLRVG